MTYPCPRCNRDDGYPICAGDERCQRTDRARVSKVAPKHTPGPWRLSQVQDGGIVHLVPVDAEGTSLLTVVNEGGYDGGEVTPFGAVYTDEDARLIAAAPELLEFAEEVRRTGDTRLASMAIAVIAKARG